MDAPSESVNRHHRDRRFYDDRKRPAPSTRPVETPPSLSRASQQARRSASSSMAAPQLTAGQFSFAPATQHTTVTTVTTTTVSLAPMLIKRPHNLLQRDPKQYPLAFSPTPASMRRFGFDVGGGKMLYEEAKDAGSFLQKYDQQQSTLQACEESVTNDEGQENRTDTPSRSVARLPRLNLHPPSTRQPMKGSTSPPSLSEAAEIATLQRRRKTPRFLTSRLDHGLQDNLSSLASSARLSLNGSSLSPVTPDADGSSIRVYPTDGSDSIPRHHRLSDITDVETRDSRHTEHPHHRQRQDQANVVAGYRRGGPPPAPIGDCTDLMRATGVIAGGAAATPPVLESDLEPVIPQVLRAEEQRAPAHTSLLNSSQQDASLPSPSLSPVTAAANLARSHANGFHLAEINEDGATSDISRLDLEENVGEQQLSGSFGSLDDPIAKGPGLARRPDIEQESSPTLMDIPEMIRTFDAMPDELQSYVMFHILKRCSKRTLQTVADVVNPALKCDPFDVLPVELGLQITKLLDGKSLCRAAQVSKRWRQLINSDETAWKDLLVRDGFELPDGEIERAVREGWGWQFPGPEGFEANIGLDKIFRPAPCSELEAFGSSDGLSSDEDSSSTPSQTARLKRKAMAQSGPSKRQKREAANGYEESERRAGVLEKSQGPMALASAAAKAVSNPGVGLPSLSSLHLFKSIYQRHHMIRNTWMDQDCQPHHLAFRAHHRHVVTCLLFDSDRIITGSDDTSINVYDTKTGVLKKTLEGHEGGVWALSAEGDTLVSGSTDRSVRVWDLRTGKCVQTFQGHTSTVRCLVILKPTRIGTDSDGTPLIYPEEPVIITGSRDSTLRVWRLPQPGDPSIHQAGPPGQNGRDNPYSLRTLSGHHNSVRAIAAYGDTLVSGSYDCTVRVWRVSTGELVHRLQGHSQKVYSVVLDHARGRCISGSMDNLVKVWSLDTGVCLFHLEGHTSLVGLLDLNHGHLVSAAADSTLRVWDPENGKCRATLSAHTGAITCFQHDGQKVISGSDRTLKMWNVETGDCVRDLLTDLSGVWQVRFDERRCVAAVQRNNLTYIEVVDFGASRDGVPAADRGRRIVVDARGIETVDEEPVEGPAAVPT